MLNMLFTSFFSYCFAFFCFLFLSWLFCDITCDNLWSGRFCKPLLYNHSVFVYLYSSRLPSSNDYSFVLKVFYHYWLWVCITVKWFYFDIMFTFFHCSLFPFQSLFCDWIYYICTSVLMLSWYYPDIIFVSVIAFISHFIMVLFSFILNFLTMFLLIFHYQAALCTTVFCLFFFVLWFLFCFLL